MKPPPSPFTRPGKTLLRRSILTCPTALMAGVVGAQTLQIDAYQERLSSFLDGVLIDNAQGRVNHPDAPPKALARSGARVSWQPGPDSGWTLSGFIDQQLQADGAGGSVAALGFANNTRATPVNTSFPFGVESQLFRRKGLSVETTWMSDGAWDPHQTWWWRANGFAIDKFKSARMNGTLSETLVGDIGLQAQLQRDELGGTSAFIHPEKALGIGWTVDVGTQWGTAENGQWRAAVSDLGPTVRIDHVLRNLTNYNTNNVAQDANGYLQYTPVTTGQYNDASATIKIQPRLSLSARWQHDARWSLFAGAERQLPFSQLHLGAEHAWGEQHASAALFLGTGGLPPSIAFGWRNSRASLQWRTDAASPGKARIWQLSGQLAF